MIVVHTSLTTRQILSSFLHEDIGSGDITTNSLLGKDLNVQAKIIAKPEYEGVVAGLEEVITIFDICRCDALSLVSDGSLVKRGQAVIQIDGKAKDVLKGERTALNLLMRMSGIATETRRLVRAVREAGSSAEISSTRKTCPGLRIFDNKAVRIGGGVMHRQRLDDMALIKNNHIRISGSLASCLRDLKKKCGSSVKIECEVTNEQELITAINEGADIVMLDNFEPQAAKEAIERITTMGIRAKSKIEISGGIRLSNIKSYAQADPDRISVGYITHSIKAIDYSMKVVK